MEIKEEKGERREEEEEEEEDKGTGLARWINPFEKSRIKPDG